MMVWHIKLWKQSTPRGADIGMKHLCFMRKCSIGETCNLIFEVLGSYRITRFQREAYVTGIDVTVLGPYRITRFQRWNQNSRSCLKVLEPYRITRFQRNGTQRKSFEKFMRSGRKERNENMGNFNTRENVIEFIRGDKQMTVTDPKGEFFVSNFLKKSQTDIKEKSFEKFMKSRRKERNE